MKKLLLLAGMVCLLLVLGACRSDNDGAGSVEDHGGFPDQISIWGFNIGDRLGHDSNAEVFAWQEISYRTGTEIEWVHGIGDAFEAFNMMIASGDWPDVIQSHWNTVPGGSVQFYNDNVILRLNDLIDNYMPNYLAALNASGGRNVLEFGEDRDMFFFAMFTDARILQNIGPMVRMEWLEAVGLDIPSTVDEVANMLRAFRDMDPNRDGNPNIMPLTGHEVKGGGPGSVSNFHMEGHIWPWGTSAYFYQVDGVVTYGPLTSEFEEGITWLNMLWEEGLIDPEFFVQGRPESDGKIMAGEAGFMTGIQASGIHNTMHTNSPEIPFTVMGIPYISLVPGGPGYVMTARFVNIVEPSAAAAITTNAANPAAVARFIDFIFSDEGKNITNFGQEGVTWEMVDGEPQFTEYGVENLIEGEWARYHWGVSTSFPQRRTFDAWSPSLHPVAEAGMVNWGGNADRSRILPTVQVAPEVAERTAIIMLDVQTYVDEQFIAFVTGLRPLSDFPTFRQTLVNWGIQEVIDARQAAFDLIN